MRATFGSYILDSDTRELLRDNAAIHVSTKAFDLLRQLIEASPNVIAKADILARLWPDTFVADGTVAGIVTELRRALEDDAKTPRFIRTVHRVGYAFCAQASTAEPANPRTNIYRLTYGDREIRLEQGPNVLGRDQTAVAWIDHPSISRRHAIVRIEGANATIEDAGSKNGTFVNGKRLHGRHELRDGDEITLGRLPVKFRAFPAGIPTESVRSMGAS